MNKANPVSFAQRRLWLLHHFEEESTAYNVINAFTINGSLDEVLLKKSVSFMFERHEIFRTAILETSDGLIQRVQPNVLVPIKEADFTEVREEEKDAKAKAFFMNIANHSFDLASPPLANFGLIKLKEEVAIFIINIHHIITDGWSQKIFCEELFQIYTNLVAQQEIALAEVVGSYVEFTNENNAVIQSSKDTLRNYWIKKLEDKPSLIELPFDKLRKSVQTFNGKRIQFKVAADIESKITALIKKFKFGTSYSFYMTVFKILLYKISGQKELVIGAPVFGRNNSKYFNTIGFFANTVVFKTALKNSETFAEYHKKVFTEIMYSISHQEYPFDLIVEELFSDRDISTSPVFNVMVAYNNTFTDTTPMTFSPGELTISEYQHAMEYNMSKFDMTFFINDDDDEKLITLEYNTDLFEEKTILNFIANFEVLLDEIIQNPFDAISNYSCLSPADQTLIAANGATKIPPTYHNILEAIEVNVTANPEKKAVVFGEDSLTYKELDTLSNALANHLIKDIQVKQGEVIGVSLDRSANMLVAMLAILKTRTAYLALDPYYPKDRVHHILEDSQVKTIITDSANIDLFTTAYQTINMDNLDLKTKTTDALPFEISEDALHDILYVIYTSGTLGLPNGAMLSHGTLLNLIEWQMHQTTIDASKNVLQFTSINFCVSFQEIFITLCSGGTVHLIDEMKRQDINYLINFIDTNKINVLYLPFSYLNFLFNEIKDTEFGTSLEHIITAGEQLKISSGLKKYIEEHKNLKIHNHYGSSEMHVVSAYTIDHKNLNAERPPIGNPITNIGIFIVDEDKQPVPQGSWGELHVEGCFEVDGYINNKELTDKKVLHVPEIKFTDKKLYKTGDIGRFNSDGNIELKGRKDSQIKIRGFRVELGEIENILLSYTGINNCVVVAQGDEENKRLVAYIESALNIAEIKLKLKSSLPNYMVPYIHLIDKIPLMPNGKTDRSQLPEIKITSEKEVVAPKTPQEKQFHAHWKEILKNDDFGITDNFFEIGGNSLLAIRLTSKIKEELNIDIPLINIFLYPTISELIEFTSQNAARMHANSSVKIFTSTIDIEKDIMLFIPPVSGDLSQMSSLITYYSKDINCIGLEYPNSHAPTIDAIEEFCEIYKKEFQEIKMLPTQKIYIVGYSMGTQIAYELSKWISPQYETQLILIDSIPAKGTLELSKETALKKSINKHILNFETLSEEEVTLFTHKIFENLKILSKYTVKGIVNCNIIAIASEENSTEIKKWNEFTTGKFKTHVIAGTNHFNILTKDTEVIKIIENAITVLQQN
ncbi:non-ribosomal peptide synthetase [Kordia sp.]|uniref:non-ribosomal peptide synthetase n=1 Tax=Kordia sp. TaxID=1965332 RepID=UPI003D29F652